MSLLLTNEDYDFNYRVRRSGREVLLDRSGHCDYFARSTLKALAAQYLRYGGWKAEMVRRRPGFDQTATSRGADFCYFYSRAERTRIFLAGRLVVVGR